MSERDIHDAAADEHAAGNTPDAVETVPAAPEARTAAGDATVAADADPAPSEAERDAAEGDLGDEDGAKGAYGNPGLPVASVIFGVVGIILGGYVSWLLSVLAGIIAIALAVFARKQNSPWPAVARAGLVMGIIDIVASIALVGIVLWRLASIGLL